VPVLEQVLEQYPDKVKVVFKNYPLSSHKFAAKAALTAQAAHLQDKFWPVHDEFFKLNEQLNDEKIQEIVRAAGVNEEQLDRDRKGPRVGRHVQEDYNEGNRIGVRALPTIFVNGKRLRDRSFESLAAAVEKELKKNPAKK
jgi:protein-disulfide isomerase